MRVTLRGLGRAMPAAAVCLASSLLAFALFIDTEPHPGWPPVAGVPDRGGHGIREEDLVREMTGDGFEVVARHQDWGGRDDRYCVVFRAANPPREN
jgi:hypothetical protein